MSKRIVIALGGNALGNTPQEQIQAVKHAVKPIVDLIEEGNEVILSHGNGPQVGMINLAMEESSKSIVKTPYIPFPECSAMSQGYIGYHLQNALREELLNRNIKKSVATIVTQVVVNENDKAFKNPNKPIGPFYSKEEAELLEKEKGYTIMEDAGRGYRRVVPSPLPVAIIEEDIIKSLCNAGHVVISVGGGGIPVIKRGNELVGISAVIDKDFATEKLAEIVDADYLIILTAVEKVSINFGKANEVMLDVINTDTLKQYSKEGHFAQGSMFPKIEAAVKFAESKQGRISLITSLEKPKEGLEGKTGTIISSN